MEGSKSLSYTDAIFIISRNKCLVLFAVLTEFAHDEVLDHIPRITRAIFGHFSKARFRFVDGKKWAVFCMSTFFKPFNRTLNS